MSEDKPTFKVTDRRLFNADGTPRDVERDEEMAAAPSADIISGSSASSTSAATNSASGTDASAGTTATSPAAKPVPRSDPAEALPSAEDESDPSAFVNLVMFIASPAAAALGMTEHPGLAGRDVDLPLAKHCIDLLGTLQQKTQGNLTAQEDQIFIGLLAELRMQFVSLSTARPAAPGAPRFTGSDITGGR